MKPISWLYISFGCTLGLIVGLRLDTAGLLLLALMMLGAMVICTIRAARFVLWPENAPVEVDVRVERPVKRDPTAIFQSPYPRATIKPRRGGWNHLQQDWLAVDEPAGAAATR